MSMTSLRGAAAVLTTVSQQPFSDWYLCHDAVSAGGEPPGACCTERTQEGEYSGRSESGWIKAWCERECVMGMADQALNSN